MGLCSADTHDACRSNAQLPSWLRASKGSPEGRSCMMICNTVLPATWQLASAMILCWRAGQHSCTSHALLVAVPVGMFDRPCPCMTGPGTARVDNHAGVGRHAGLSDAAPSHCLHVCLPMHEWH